MEFISQLLRIAQVVFGIGLVIFVHEAGHFIAARLCKVRVEVFSLGFGPRLFGWRRGHTLYQVAAVPLGGFVKMAGDEIERDPDQPPREWELPAKSVPARFFIYSGGVLMNIAFALVVFPFVLAGGLPSNLPLVGDVEPGSPAWEARFPIGSRILAVNDTPIYDFYHIQAEVAYSGAETAVFQVQVPGEAAPREIELKPRYVDSIGIYRVGLRPAVDQELRLSVDENTPAWEAGLRDGDRLVGVEGGSPVLRLEDQLRNAIRSGEPIDLRVERAGAGEIHAHIAPEEERLKGKRLFGVEVASVHLANLRDGEISRQLDLRPGDRLRAVGDTELYRRGDLFQALRSNLGQPVTMHITRAGSERTIEVPPLTEAQAAGLADDLDLEPDFDDVLIATTPGGSAEAAGLLNGDRIISVGEISVRRWEEFQKAARQLARTEEPIAVSVLRTVNGAAGPEKVVREFEIEPTEPLVRSWGFDLRPAEYIFQTNGIQQSMSVGIAASWRFLVDTWRSLRRMLTREVSTENLGGIITISVVSHNFAAQGWAKLFFFLCMLSMNLALINVLPIPVLDGGHLFFLMIEGIKGSPVSERTLGYSQIVGLVLLLSLMVYVTYNDIARWFLPQNW